PGTTTEASARRSTSGPSARGARASVGTGRRRTCAPSTASRRACSGMRRRARTSEPRAPEPDGGEDRRAALAQHAPVDVGQRRRAGLAHGDLELSVQYAQYLGHALAAEGAETPDVGPADADGVRAQGERL